MKTKIVDLSHEGKGIAKPEGIVTFIDGALPEEEVTITNIQKKKRIQTGDLVSVDKKSANRIEPFCPYFGECGGCSLQHLDYEAGTHWKRERIQKLLDKFRVNTTVAEIRKMGSPYLYRNHVQFQVQKGHIGFYRKGTHSLVEINECLIQDAMLMAFLFILRERDLTGIEKIYVRKLDQGLSISTIGKGVLHFTEAEIDLAALTSYWTKESERKGQWKNIFQKKEETITLLDVSYTLRPPNFFQVNNHMAEELFTEAIEKMDIQKNETILDLYCGVGSIALQAAKRGANVIGIEIQKEAIQRAKENAKLNGMTNARFFAEKAEERPDEILKKYNPKGVFVDPPRAGLDEKLIHALTESKVEKVVYVSCDPVTLIRDLSRFQESGWGIGEVVPFDLFPWTGHVETVVLMSRAR